MKNAISPDTPATLATLATQARFKVLEQTESGPEPCNSGAFSVESGTVDRVSVTLAGDIGDTPATLATQARVAAPRVEAENDAAPDTPATLATRPPTLADLAAALGSAFAIEAGPEGRRMVRTAEVLTHAVEDDATDLLTPAVLVAFGWSLAADGLVEAWTEPTTPAADPPAVGPARVCCADCRHFERDTIGSGQGIGSCAIGDPTLPSDQPHMDHRHQAPAGERIRRFTIRTRPALWPRAERFCPGFEGVE